MQFNCSVIGSFRKYYEDVLSAIKYFEQNGIQVLSPKKSTILDKEVEFVIFNSDDRNHSSVEIQLIALHRILRSDFVYVCNPNGYIGKTTCYEIGRIVERKIPIYFQEFPEDLPIYLSEMSICNHENIVSYIQTHNELPVIGKSKSHFADELNTSLIYNKFYE